MEKSFDTKWEAIHRNQEWGKYPSEHVVRWVARNYYSSSRKDVKVLDFGVGGGANTWFLAREGFDVYGFDGSSSAVEKAKEYLSREGLSAELIVKDGLQLSYKEEFFDFVIDNVSICHNSEAAKETMYAEVFKYLKKGGKLFSTCFSSNTTKELPAYLTFYKNKEEIEDVLMTIGYINVVIDVDTYTDNGDTVELYIIKCEKRF